MRKVKMKVKPPPNADRIKGEFPAGVAVELAEIGPEHFVCGLDETPPSNPHPDRGEGPYTEVMISIHEKDGEECGLKPGYYRSPLSPWECATRLLKYQWDQERKKRMT